MSARQIADPSQHGWVDLGNGKWGWGAGGSSGGGVDGITSTATEEQLVLTDTYLASNQDITVVNNLPRVYFQTDSSLVPGNPKGEIGYVDGKLYLRAGQMNAAQIMLDPAYPGSTVFSENVIMGSTSGSPVFDMFTRRDETFQPGVEASYDFTVTGLDDVNRKGRLVCDGDNLVLTSNNYDGKQLRGLKIQMWNVGGKNLGDITCSNNIFVNNGSSPVTTTRHLIETLHTLREATKEETTVEDLRDAIGNAVGGLIEKFEAMQSPVTQEVDA